MEQRRGCHRRADSILPNFNTAPGVLQPRVLQTGFEDWEVLEVRCIHGSGERIWRGVDSYFKAMPKHQVGGEGIVQSVFLRSCKFRVFFLGWESRRLSLALAVLLKARPGLAPLGVSGQNPIDVSRTWVWAIITGKTRSLNGEMSAAIHSSIPG